MPVKEHMTLEKRKQLRMSTRDAINLRKLHREVRSLMIHIHIVCLYIIQLENARMEVQETKDTVKLKYVWFDSCCKIVKNIYRYVPVAKKLSLKEELLAKEV